MFGWLRRLVLFGDPSKQCEMCGYRPAHSSKALPMQETVAVCRLCRDELDAKYADPLHSHEFLEVIDSLRLSRGTVLSVPWGATREEVVRQLPDSVAPDQPLQESDTRLQIDLTLAGQYELETVWTFAPHEDRGLTKVSISPRSAVIDAYFPVQQRFGEAADRSTEAGTNRYTWRTDPCVIELTETSYHTVTLTIGPHDSS